MSPQVDPLTILDEKYVVMPPAALPTGCWEWSRAKTGKGYGCITIDGRYWLAHRLAYTLYVGPIPAGRELHHKCHNKPCINPDHLAPLTHAAHAVQSDSAAGIGLLKTHCPQGHEYSTANTIISKSGSRSCRACNNEKTAARRRARRQLTQRNP